MRTFWIILALLAIAAAAAVWSTSKGAGERAAPAVVTAPEPPREEPRAAPENTISEKPVPAEKPAPAEATQPSAPAPEDPAASIAALLPGLEPSALPPPVLPAPAPAGKDAGVSAERRPDGSLLLDGVYTVRGEGTAASPYEITWELLTSAQATYEPKLGKKQLPGRITMLKDKVVRITGHVAFPLYVQEADELLVMLNQWDGCCIGVPPTPYDAVEVRLKTPATGGERFATYGTLEGVLGVEPYLSGDWLIGLYTMRDAKLTVKAQGGFGL